MITMGATNPVPLKPVKPKDRTTVILQVHHQSEGIVSAGASFDELLETRHDAYARRTSVGEEWQPLDFGWIPANDVGRIVIENLTGRNLQVNPTEAERVEMRQQVLQVVHDGDSCPFLIPPRGVDAYVSATPAKLRIRSQLGVTRYKITVVPR